MVFLVLVTQYSTLAWTQLKHDRHVLFSGDNSPAWNFFFPEEFVMLNGQQLIHRIAMTPIGRLSVFHLCQHIR